MDESVAVGVTCPRNEKKSIYISIYLSRVKIEKRERERERQGEREEQFKCK